MAEAAREVTSSDCANVDGRGPHERHHADVSCTQSLALVTEEDNCATHTHARLDTARAP